MHPGERSLFDVVGGLPFFERLVDRFYDGVASDPDLLRVYPTPEDLSAARRKLALFLAEYWGGPAGYSELHGHPRLRMRHAPFDIGPLEVDRWLAHMRDAVEALQPDPMLARALMTYFEMGAGALRNRE